MMNLRKRVYISGSIILILCCLGVSGGIKIKDVTDATFQQKALNHINQVRALHNAPPVRLNSKLSLHALEWCEELLQKAEKEHLLKRLFAHGKFEGENVFIKNVKRHEDITAKIAVNDWYCEGNAHDFSNNFIRGDTAQFTQLIWRSVTHVGISKAVDESTGNMAIVARFHPVGNLGYRKSFEENVLEPTTTSSFETCYGSGSISREAEPTTIITESPPIGRASSLEFATETPQVLAITTTLPSVTTTTTAATTTTTTTTTTPRPTTTRPPRPRPDPMGLALRELDYDDDDNNAKDSRKHSSTYERVRFT